MTHSSVRLMLACLIDAVRAGSIKDRERAADAISEATEFLAKPEELP